MISHRLSPQHNFVDVIRTPSSFLPLCNQVHRLKVSSHLYNEYIGLISSQEAAPKKGVPLLD